MWQDQRQDARAWEANLYRMRMALAQSAPGLETLIAQ